MPVPYLGDFPEDDTVFIVFNTFTSDDPSASCTITDFINTDVHIHKEDDLSQRNNAAGITVSVDFDGITGSHMVKIDTSDDTVAGFWVTGKDYFVRIEGTTIDGATVNVFIGHFSIENRYNPVTDYDGPTKAEMDTAHALLATAVNLATVDTVVDGIQTDLDNGTDGLGALKALIDALNDLASADVETACGAALITYDPPTRTELTTDKNSIITEVDANEAKIDALENISAANVETACGSALATYDPPTRGELTTDKNSIITEIDANETKIDALNNLSAAQAETACDNALATYDPPTRGELTTDKNAIITEIDANETKIDALNNLSAAQVNAEIVDALNVDTYGEPGQEAPGVTVSLVKKIGYLYKAWRNKWDNDGSTRNLYNDDAATVDQKSTVAEAGGTVTVGEMESGP